MSSKYPAILLVLITTIFIASSISALSTLSDNGLNTTGNVHAELGLSGSDVNNNNGHVYTITDCGGAFDGCPLILVQTDKLYDNFPVYQLPKYSDWNVWSDGSYWYAENIEAGIFSTGGWFKSSGTDLIGNMTGYGNLNGYTISIGSVYNSYGTGKNGYYNKNWFITGNGLGLFNIVGTRGGYYIEDNTVLRPLGTSDLPNTAGFIGSGDNSNITLNIGRLLVAFNGTDDLFYNSILQGNVQVRGLTDEFGGTCSGLSCSAQSTQGDCVNNGCTDNGCSDINGGVTAYCNQWNGQMSNCDTNYCSTDSAGSCTGDMNNYCNQWNGASGSCDTNYCSTNNAFTCTAVNGGIPAFCTQWDGDPTGCALESFWCNAYDTGTGTCTSKGDCGNLFDIGDCNDMVNNGFCANNDVSTCSATTDCASQFSGYDCGQFTGTTCDFNDLSTCSPTIDCNGACTDLAGTYCTWNGCSGMECATDFTDNTTCTGNFCTWTPNVTAGNFDTQGTINTGVGYLYQGTPAPLSIFVNDLGNYGGWVTGAQVPNYETDNWAKYKINTRNLEMGYSYQSSGQDTLCLGSYCFVNGTGSISLGFNTTSNGMGSIAEGYNVYAGQNAVGIGKNVYANNNQFILNLGTYNLINMSTTGIFIKQDTIQGWGSGAGTFSNVTLKGGSASGSTGIQKGGNVNLFGGDTAGAGNYDNSSIAGSVFIKAGLVDRSSFTKGIDGAIYIQSPTTLTANLNATGYNITASQFNAGASAGLTNSFTFACHDIAGVVDKHQTLNYTGGILTYASSCA